MCGPDRPWASDCVEALRRLDLFRSEDSLYDDGGPVFQYVWIATTNCKNGLGTQQPVCLHDWWNY